LSRWQWVDLFNDDSYERLLKSLDTRAKAIGIARVRGRHMPHPILDTPQSRVLEAAIKNQVTVEKPAFLFVRIRRPESESIIVVIGSVDEDIVLSEADVKAKTLEIEFPIDKGRILPASIYLRLIAPEFSPAMQGKMITIPPAGDSEVCTFIVTPIKVGELLLSLEVVKDEINLATRTLRTTAIKIEEERRSPVLLVSLPIVVLVQPSMSVVDSISGLELEEKRKTKPKVEAIREKTEPKKKHSKPVITPIRPRRIDPLIIVALIGLVGTIIAAALTSPFLIALIQRNPIPTSTLFTPTSTYAPPIATSMPYVTVQDFNVLENGIIIATVKSDETTNVTVGSSITIRAVVLTNIAREDLSYIWNFCSQPGNNQGGQDVSEILYQAPITRGADCARLIIYKGSIRLGDQTIFFDVK